MKKLIMILCLLSTPVMAEMKCENKVNYHICQDEKNFCTVYVSRKKRMDCIKK